VTGIVTAITFFGEFILLLARYLAYKFSKGNRRQFLLATGAAIKLSTFVKGVCQSLISNSLAGVFSVLGGFLGMLLPAPPLNLILSGILSIVGFMLRRYIGGLPSNIYLCYKYGKERK
jgi:hypothetical protein